jgi:phosphoglycerol transferase MdoB-like AlkP superfamily enzyme
MPFALGNQFKRMGVESKAYHNHTYTYYQRNETHPNLGYLFKGKGNGLVLESDVWPESDLEMINATVDEYIGEERFHVYYLTVSGHMNYTFMGNSMAYKNRKLVEDLPYSSDVKAYIACQIELDRALEQLIKKLEEANVADRTVIALSADHYPYGWEKEKLDELAGHEVDPNFEVYRNHFILWSAGMKQNIIVDEPCSSLDILPTLSNLFGLEYDSRLLMGRDVFSDAPPLVILSDRSFITDKVMYNSKTGEVIKLTEEELPEDYIKTVNNIVKNKFSVSKSIVEKDYYRRVFPLLFTP